MSQQALTRGNMFHLDLPFTSNRETTLMRLPLPIIAVLTLMLAACGGGGGSSSVEDARTLTDSEPPIETAANQSARAAGIISRIDSLILSSGYGNTSHPDFPSFTIRSTCSGARCVLREPRSGLVSTLTIDDLAINNHDARISVNHSKHGITLSGGEANDGGLKALGAWMQNGAFQVSEEHVTQDGIDIWVRSGLVGGDLTGSRPGSSATWRGVMVGTPAAGTSRGDFLQGDARVIYSFSGTIDADFTNIKNIDRNRVHTVAAVRFDDVPVRSDGTFQAGVTGNRIQGGFYGSGHAETVGVFEQLGVVGAFGGLGE